MQHDLARKKWHQAMLGFLFLAGLLLAGHWLDQAQEQALANTVNALEDEHQRELKSLQKFLNDEYALALKISESPLVKASLHPPVSNPENREETHPRDDDLKGLLRGFFEDAKAQDGRRHDKLVVLGADNQTLAEFGKTQAFSSASILNRDFKNKNISIEGNDMVLSVPIKANGIYLGAALTWTPVKALQTFLESKQADSPSDRLLVHASGKLIAGSSRGNIRSEDFSDLNLIPADQITAFPVQQKTDVNHSQGWEALVLRSEIPGTPFSLLHGVKPPLSFKRVMANPEVRSGVLLMVVAVLFFAFVLVEKIKLRRMKKRLEESSQQKALLDLENEELNREIARRITTEKELRNSEERYRMYMDHAPEGILVFDPAGFIIDANDAINEMLECNAGALIGRHIKDILQDHSNHAFARVIDALASADSFEMHTVLNDFHGEALLTDLKFVALPGGRTICFCVDVTEKKRAEAEINNLAYFDPLTDLPNRRLLWDRIQQAVLRARRGHRRCAVLMLDLDHFKNLNDTLGHDVGDLLLCAVARRLTAAVRQEDTVARIGVDEFIVLVDGLASDDKAAWSQIHAIVSKIQMDIGQPYELLAGKSEYQCGCSMGIALYAHADSTVDVLMKQADVALYEAKKSGRNTFRIFTPEMQAIIEERAKIESALRKALPRNELQVYCQGQTDGHGRVIGGELLLRWMREGASTSVSPAVFIPLAEESGLIGEFGEWVLHQACEILEKWQHSAETSFMTLSVNISGLHFHEPGFVDSVIQLLGKFTFPMKRLKIELTESVVIKNVDIVARKMAALKGLGILFSLDDFGTGYSSLSYLKSLPLDELKIDKSFVRDISTDPNDAAIVRAIVAMSQSLGFGVVAEGVETHDQKDFLLQNGCGKLQGFLYSRPVHVNEFMRQLLRMQPAESAAV